MYKYTRPSSLLFTPSCSQLGVAPLGGASRGIEEQDNGENRPTEPKVMPTRAKIATATAP